MHRIRSLLEGSLQVEGKHLQGKSRDRWYLCRKEVGSGAHSTSGASKDEYKKVNYHFCLYSRECGLLQGLVL
jgi:hypothetical protein